jgi:hypothetical protein
MNLIKTKGVGVNLPIRPRLCRLGADVEYLHVKRIVINVL